MKRLLSLCAVGVMSALLVSSAAYAKNDEKHDKKNEHNHEQTHDDDYKHKDKNKDKSLPPGLEKKVAKGEPLPPGWQKKLRKGDILDRDYYDRGKVVVPVGKDGAVSIKIDDSIIKIDEKTRKILDIVDIISN